MNVLILGSNGFIGTSIASQALARGLHVIGMSRSDTPTMDAGMAYVSGDRLDTDFVKHTIAAHKVDVVVDVIPMRYADTDPLLASIDGIVGQYVMISSCDVYANYDLLHRRGHGEPVTVADEDSPVRSNLYPYRASPPRAACQGRPPHPPWRTVMSNTSHSLGRRQFLQTTAASAAVP